MDKILKSYEKVLYLHFFANIDYISNTNKNI